MLLVDDFGQIRAWHPGTGQWSLVGSFPGNDTDISGSYLRLVDGTLYAISGPRRELLAFDLAAGRGWVESEVPFPADECSSRSECNAFAWDAAIDGFVVCSRGGSAVQWWVYLPETRTWRQFELPFDPPGTERPPMARDVTYHPGLDLIVASAARGTEQPMYVFRLARDGG